MQYKIDARTSMRVFGNPLISRVLNWQYKPLHKTGDCHPLYVVAPTDWHLLDKWNHMKWL